MLEQGNGHECAPRGVGAPSSSRSKIAVPASYRKKRNAYSNRSTGARERSRQTWPGLGWGWPLCERSWKRMTGRSSFARSSAWAPPLPSACRFPTRGSRGMANGKRILVVEDAEDLTTILRDRFRREGYRVDTVQDGESALQT